MRRAIELSCESVSANGGPFGAVVVREGRIIGEGTNKVVDSRDPTAHAEIVAIRSACNLVGSHFLETSLIFTSCEPCPMCLGAIWWARIGVIYYGNSRSDAAAIGFDDAALYEETAKPLGLRTLPIRRLLSPESRRAFELWEAKPDRRHY